MSHYKLQPTKSKLFYRLIPTLAFIIAITTIVLTMFFMFVLQSRNAYELDSGDDAFNIEHDDFKMEIDGATADQIANLDIDDISFEDNIDRFTTTQPPPYETFLLKKTINPATNNHIQTNNNLQSMKAYKIVSKKPIIENSLVKIVMAPHNVLEKLSRQDQHNDDKYAIDTIDKSGNVPIKEHSSDDIYGRELIQNGNGNANVNVEVFSMEDDENIDFTKVTDLAQHVLVDDFKNIQVIAKSHQQQLDTISNESKTEFKLEEKAEGHNFPSRNESEGVSQLHQAQLDMKSMEIPVIEPNYTTLPLTTEDFITDPTYKDAEELLSNPTTTQNLIPTLIPESEEIPESIKIPKSEEILESKDLKIDSDKSEINSSPPQIENVGHRPMTSTENSTPMVVLKILKNRTVLMEETQSTPYEQGMETTSVRNVVTPVRRPKKKTQPTNNATEATTLIEVKQSQFPKKATHGNSYHKPRNFVPKLDDISFELTAESNLNFETTEVSSAKSKNTKRAIGDEGSFASNIVRPSPIRPKTFGDLFPKETEAERAERLSKSMQRLMHFVTIAGHVDSYLTKRVRNGLKNVARIFDSVEHTRRRRSNL